MLITADLLRQKRACASQIARLEALFPDGVEPTSELCLSVASEFDWDWAAAHLLPHSAEQAYAAARLRAREACDAAVAPAREAHDAALASVWQAYDAALAPARQACHAAALASAWQAYVAALASAREAYNAARAIAFGTLARGK